MASLITVYWIAEISKFFPINSNCGESFWKAVDLVDKYEQLERREVD